MAANLSIETIAPRLEQLGVDRDALLSKVAGYMAFKVPEAEAVKAAINHFSQEKGFEVKDAYSALRYTVSGAIVGIQSGSGLIYRCPECGRALFKGECSQDGKVDDVNDLRLKLLVDDGKSIYSVVLNRELTEELIGVNVEQASKLAAMYLDKSVVMDTIKAKLLGRYITATVTVLGDYYIAKSVTVGACDVSTAPPIESIRNIAHRLSAAVFDHSTTDSEPVEGFAHEAKFIVTPKGVKVNRVFVVGALLSVPEVTNSVTLKARLTDRTGSFLLLAGEFSQEARQKLAEMQVPTYLAIIGKIGHFASADGRIIKYIRPEEVAVVDESVQKLWEAEVKEVV